MVVKLLLEIFIPLYEKHGIEKRFEGPEEYTQAVQIADPNNINMNYAEMSQTNNNYQITLTTQTQTTLIILTITSHTKNQRMN